MCRKEATGRLDRFGKEICHISEDVLNSKGHQSFRRSYVHVMLVHVAHSDAAVP